MPSIRRVALIGVVALATLAAACSGTSSDSSSTSQPGGGPSGPLRIGSLWEVSGESQVAVNDYENAALLAIEEINAAGGFGGQPVERYRVATSVLDFQKTTASFLQAVDQNPSVLVGFALPAQLQAINQQINRAQVPVIATTNAQPFLRLGAPAGSEYLWVAKSYDPDVITLGVDYFVDQLNLSKVGLMGTNESNGQEGINVAAAALQAQGLQPFATAQYPPTASDLTQQVVAMQGADGVLNWGFPNTVALQLRQFLANGLTIPTLTNDSAAIAVNSKLVEGPAIDKLYVTSNCNPADASYSPALAEFTRKYQARFGTPASTSAGIVYDAIYLALDAAKAAGSADPAAINAAMPQVKRPDGVCGTYEADAAHILNHQAVVSKYSADASSKTLEVKVLPPQQAQ